MGSTDVRWFDLGRFGAALRVVPKDPLRGIALTCLEITDIGSYERAVGFGPALSEPERAQMRDQQCQALDALGFVASPTRLHVERPDGTEGAIFRFFSPKSEFTLRELRELLPDLGPEDLRLLPSSAIVLESPLSTPGSPGNSDAWSSFARDVLAKEAIGVWTPQINPFEGPWEAAAPLRRWAPAGRHEALRVAMVPTYAQVIDRLERAQVRENALIPFYVELADALSAGHRPDQLRKVDLPFALPLWADADGKVVALQDVRFAPEILACPPDRAYRFRPEGGLVVGALREVHELRQLAEAEIAQWRIWAQAPEAVTASGFQESLERVVGARVAFQARHPRWSDVTRGLVERGPDDRPGAVKAVAALRPDDMDRVADVLGALLGSASGLRDELTTLGRQLLRCAHDAAAEAARAAAKAELQRVAEAVKESDTADAGIKHVDAGVKIGGARKDYAKRWLAVEDIEAMTELERKQLVVKKNVYPPLDYRQLREQGVPAGVAMGLKVLKDALASSPSGDRDGGGDPSVAYTQAIGVVRDRLVSVRTREDLLAAMKALCEAGRRETDGTLSRYITGGSVLQRQWGREFANLVWEGADGYLPRKMREQVERHVERAAHRDPENPEAGWSALIKAPRVKSDAEKEALRTKAEVDAELHRPHLEKVERIGEDWRNGKEIGADEILQHFGFRAIEFGNWLPQDERQRVLSMAFDSLCDLAHALALPPKALSFGGELAVAFGSRGTGGRHAALAHFEPARNVINLTRLKGAGTLAHEFWHAFDWYSGGGHRYASQMGRGQPEAMRELVHRLQWRRVLAEELLAKARTSATQGRDYAVSWMYQQGTAARAAAAEFMKEAFARATAAFGDSAMQTLKAWHADPRLEQVFQGDAAAVSSEQMMGWGDRMLRGLSDLADVRPAWSNARDKIDNNIRWSLRNLAVQTTMEVARDQGMELSQGFYGGRRSVASDFVENAKRLDHQRSAPYWATVPELLARAGAAYVHDRLDALKQRSDYLVFGAGAEQYADHPIGNPNPMPADRASLAPLFDRVLLEYRLQHQHRSQASAELA